jgi:predicted nuclease of predicted toxin-antitoxin system
VKLLSDENLSPRLGDLVADLFPQSAQVHELGLGAKSDLVVWEHARDNGFALVSKDSDFNELVQIIGYPPKLVWLRRGNCSTAAIAELLRAHRMEIQRLESDPELAVLAI